MLGQVLPLLLLQMLLLAFRRAESKETYENIKTSLQTQGDLLDAFYERYSEQKSQLRKLNKLYGYSADVTNAYTRMYEAWIKRIARRLATVTDEK